MVKHLEYIYINKIYYIFANVFKISRSRNKNNNIVNYFYNFK